MAKIKIERMARPEHGGDWHDAPSRWQVIGPGSELQKFSTREDARRYARIRRTSPDFATASHDYVCGTDKRLLIAAVSYHG